MGVRKRQRRMTKLAGFPSNRYNLIDNDDQFQLTMDVPGVKEEDIDIKLDDGQLTVQGHRTIGSESSRFSSKFFRSFSLDPTVDIDSFTATLKNGVLTVSAPKDLSKLEENVRRIPITLAEDIEDGDSKDNTNASAEDKEVIDVETPVDSDQANTNNNTHDNSNVEKTQ